MYFDPARPIARVGSIGVNGLGRQIEHGVLHARKPIRRFVLRIARRLCRRRAFGQFVQQVKLRLRLPRPLREQRMTDFVIVERIGGFERERAPFRHNVEPILPARVHDVEPDVHPARQLAQQRNIERRDGWRREHADRGRPARAHDRVEIERANEIEKPVRRGRRVAVTRPALRLRDFGEHRAPKRRLPALVFAHGV
jgi:hypothetical protein